MVLLNSSPANPMIRSISSASSRLPPMAPVSVFTDVIPRTDCSNVGWVGPGVGAGVASAGPATGVVGPGVGGPVCSPATIGLGPVEADAPGDWLGAADGDPDGVADALAAGATLADGCGVLVGDGTGVGGGGSVGRP